ncbi:replication protein A 70 kDa DNA-binding subunit-like [Panicum miliaceum]|uniref:Replication protein A 70 kDa DNA-binding subunit-like n=1 Tax=Panicum miliaceum TaxID=4540 RepID=A0A3L6PIP0_PANMI|nr:replication protein A 70 kDa DNA-binding subunit-like [Panicum miliaceum]
MYAKVPAAEADRHGPILQTDGTYIISRFRVCNAKNVYKSIDNPFMLELTCHTKISVATEPITEPKYVYRLTPFEELPDYINDTKNFHDVLGIITEINEPQWTTFTNQPNPTLRRDIKIKSKTGQEMRLALWGSKATQVTLPSDLMSTDKPTVILLTGCLIKNYFSEPYISGYAACHWYINPAIPEATALIATVQGQSLRIKQLGIPIAEQAQPEPQPLPDLLTLKEMQDMDPYDFPATAGGIHHAIYAKNPANQMALPISASNATAASTHTNTHRYKLPFIASDGTEESEMIAFAGIAHRIVGKPVETIMRSARNRDNIPADIAAIVSSKYTFSVTMSEESFRKEKNHISTVCGPSEDRTAKRRLQLTDTSIEQDESYSYLDSQVEMEKESETASNLDSNPPQGTPPLPAKTRTSKTTKNPRK